MDFFRCTQEELPSQLWRVQYKCSQTKESDEGNLLAADTHTFYDDSQEDLEDFRQSVTDHCTWKHREPTPYISLFSDEDHARNWAMKPFNSTGDDCTLLTIDTKMLEGVYVFRLQTLVDDLSIKIPEKASGNIPRAYICLHRIPNAAIIQIKTKEQMQLDLRNLQAMFEGLTLQETFLAELANKLTFEIGRTILIRSSNECSGFNKQYHQRFLEVKDPSSSTSISLVLPKVVIHRQLSEYFGKTSVMFGVPKWIVNVIQSKLTAAGGSAEFCHRKLVSDEEYWWTRCNFKDAEEKDYIVVSTDDGGKAHAGFRDFFQTKPRSVLADVTCSMKMTCETAKREEPEEGDEWRAGLSVSMVRPIGDIDILAPRFRREHLRGPIIWRHRVF